jgi:hypothetical protein
MYIQKLEFRLVQERLRTKEAAAAYARNHKLNGVNGTVASSNHVWNEHVPDHIVDEAFKAMQSDNAFDDTSTNDHISNNSTPLSSSGRTRRLPSDTQGPPLTGTQRRATATSTSDRQTPTAISNNYNPNNTRPSTSNAVGGRRASGSSSTLPTNNGSSESTSRSSTPTNKSGNNAPLASSRLKLLHQKIADTRSTKPSIPPSSSLSSNSRQSAPKPATNSSNSGGIIDDDPEAELERVVHSEQQIDDYLARLLAEQQSDDINEDDANAVSGHHSDNEHYNGTEDIKSNTSATPSISSGAPISTDSKRTTIVMPVPSRATTLSPSRPVTSNNNNNGGNGDDVSASDADIEQLEQRLLALDQRLAKALV